MTQGSGGCVFPVGTCQPATVGRGVPLLKSAVLTDGNPRTASLTVMAFREAWPLPQSSPCLVSSAGYVSARAIRWSVPQKAALGAGAAQDPWVSAGSGRPAVPGVPLTKATGPCAYLALLWGQPGGLRVFCEGHSYVVCVLCAVVNTVFKHFTFYVSAIVRTCK